jgi:hypothetical protein
VAQEFAFYQRPKKLGNDEWSVADEIKSMVAAGYMLATITSEIRCKDRDRSEYWWQLKKRLERKTVSVGAGQRFRG